VFWRVEGQTGLYVLFKTVCDNYELLPAENYKLPPEAEGLEPIEEVSAPAPSILKPEALPSNKSAIEEEFINIVGRTNTRRHIRQSPSVGSAVTTVLESDEEDPDVTQKLGDLHITDEEGEAEGGAEIPVIVETFEVEDHEAEPKKELELEIESKPEPEPEHEHEPIEDAGSPPTADTDSAPSSTASWDRMSSESLEEKLEEPEASEKAHPEKLDPALESEDTEAVPGAEADAEVKVEVEAKQPESEEDTLDEVAMPTAKESEDEKADKEKKVEGS
jgi:hypothetical protein